ncbi:UPF0325 protein YaeH [Pseudonocardia sp. Ae168_Ps1]|uniref:DUF4041 domain-containing protein n=1 Tax=unclassified Pseudonocardia TaxID=2619320 RepID=UPI00094AEDEB|nr:MULTISPECIES: DUF4041 domain-containing protein [unclassified Pseudonocardia]OLL72246.1 UPF0325 protein YaeH [Pseudonocardia sp. Ae150A_Ps1]OLL78216.1 UPF0325 protein YaeH [Pseudonocardia sp. Ae168_Ps1]OLL87662.1 UPF0325 protein YaeH [Pseudonocardia sp. Ae263_Ps1]OLL92311.1 UPF0325 protein YaeH [Pseudonocardia sp. Ae356_Ps1]
MEKHLHATEQRAAQEANGFRHEIGRLRQENLSLRNRDAVAYAQEAEHAAARLDEVRATLASATEAVRTEHLRAREIAEQNRAILTRAVVVADDIVSSARAKAGEREQTVETELAARRARVAELDQQIVVTEDIAMLQEAGIYEFRHRLDDAVAYKARLNELKDRYKTLQRNDDAVLAASGWTVNGSATEGRRMLRDYTKLMLRAYNAEADNCVRTMRPHRLASSIDRLTKARDTTAKLGRTMQIRVSEPYHRARIEELELTADHLAKQEEEKERIRAEREQARDEEAARREFEREKARLLKEQNHWQLVQDRWRSQGDEVKVAEAQSRLDQLGSAIEGVEAREANVRTGHVYVISNVGAFGEHMVKIGMTRRLDPNDRVRELGDASVPFKFDIHALVFSSDAVALENHLHRQLADRRVNRVNLRREFFHATPTEVLDVLRRTDHGDNVLEFTEIAEAEEWRASVGIADRPA